MKTLCRVRQYISQSLALQLYTSLILPDFDYADVIYDSISLQNASKLQVLQNQCLKACTRSDKRMPTAELHKISNLPLLSTRRKVHTCNFVYKGVNTLLSRGVNHMFEHQVPRVTNNTSSIEHLQLKVPRSRLKLGKGNVRVRGPEYYNSISLDTKKAPTYKSFKNRIKKELY